MRAEKTCQEPFFPSNSGGRLRQDVPVTVNSIRGAPAAGPRVACTSEYRNMKRAAR
jgi:hypothetical protein